MTEPIQGWTQLNAEPLVLLREYSFGAGQANALAIRLPDGKLLLVSPPCDPSTSEQDALARLGGVSALLANNGAHYMGLASWRRRFPDAVAYATDSARERIAKKSREPVPLQPIEQLEPKLGDKIEVIAAPGCKVGDVIVHVRGDRGWLVYMGDFFANILKLPANPLFRLVFKLSKSAPGFRVFGIFFRFFVRDRPALRDFLIGELQRKPPAVVVPGHGAVIERSALGATMISMLREAVRG